jgi:hypothetical protein
VDEPTKDLREAVAGVADICERMQPFDRMVWMATWQHAADVVAGEDKDVEVTIENTMGLRLFTGSIFDVAWDRWRMRRQVRRPAGSRRAGFHGHDWQRGAAVD